MSRNALIRRLEAIEGKRFSKEPECILADRPMDGDEGADALANWRSLVSTGKARVSNGVLCIIGPALTEDEWMRSHCFGQ